MPLSSSPPPPPSSQDANRSRHPSRLAMFAMLYVSYCGYYLCRKNYTFWMAEVARESNLTKVEAGMSSSAFQMAQATARLVLAVWIDTHSPRKILAGALGVSAAINAAMCFVTSSPFSMALLWGFNGVVQSLGWPALARIFMEWFSPSERGKWYTLLSTSQNTGSALVPLIVPTSMQWTGSWSAALFVPAVISLCISLLVFVLVGDSPRSDSLSKAREEAEPNGGETVQGSKLSVWAILRDQVFLNPAMLFLSLCYMGVTCLRVIFADWAVQLLRDGWSLGSEGASSCILLLEAGGFIGSLVAGYVSDDVFKGRRAPVISILGFLSAVPALLLMQGPGMVGGIDSKYLPAFASSSEYVPHLAFLLLGLFSFAPHVLIGLAAREWVHPKAGTSAHGLVSFIARLGGAAAGAPFGRYVQESGWGGGMWLVVGMSVFSGVAMLPLWSKVAFRLDLDEKKNLKTQGKKIR